MEFKIDSKRKTFESDAHFRKVERDTEKTVLCRSIKQMTKSDTYLHNAVFILSSEQLLRLKKFLNLSIEIALEISNATLIKINKKRRR